MAKLTNKQKCFVQEYLIDLNATQAAIRAGYSKKTAGITGFHTLKIPKIQAAITRAMQARSKRTEISQDRVLEELARLAFIDPVDFYDDNGNLLSIVDMPEDARRAIGGIEATITNVEHTEGSRTEESLKKIKILDKKGSLEMLGRHLKMFTDKKEVSGPDGKPIGNKWIIETVEGKPRAK